MLERALDAGAPTLFSGRSLNDIAGSITPSQASLLISLGWDVAATHGGRNALHAALCDPAAWRDDAATAADTWRVLLRAAPAEALLAQDTREEAGTRSLATPLHMLCGGAGAGAGARRGLLEELLGRCVEDAPTVFWRGDYKRRTPAQVGGGGLS